MFFYFINETENMEHMWESSRRSGSSQRTAEEEPEQENEARYVRIVGEGLRKPVGGVQLCREDELTRAVMLEFLKS